MTNRAELRAAAKNMVSGKTISVYEAGQLAVKWSQLAHPAAVLFLLDECESLHSALGSPDEITAEPAGDYDALRKQFMSLLMLANSKAKQAQHWRSQSGHDMHQTLVQTAANVNAERDTNAMLTDALMKAEAERDAALAELEALRIQVSTLTEWYSNALDVISEVSAAIPGVTYMYPPDGGDVSIPEQIRRMAKDAERYRWLRTADWWVSPLCVIRDPKQNAKLGSDCPSRDRLDKAIDAAMSQEANHA